MNYKTFFVIFGWIYLSLLGYMTLGCASVHSGHMAIDDKGQTVTKDGISVSGIENTRLSSKYFLPLDFTFENATSDWVIVEKVSLTFLDESVSAKMLVPVGKDLITWAEAAQQNAAISSYNTALLLGAIASAGAVGARSTDAGVSKASSLAMVGAGVGLAAGSFGQNLSDLEKAKVLPDSHLFAGTFAIPPGLHSKKWVTLYTKAPLSLPYLRDVEVTLTIKNGEPLKFKVPFRKTIGNSDFQSSHPENDKRKLR